MQLVVERRVDRLRRRYHQDGVPVGCRIHNCLRADIARRAGPVLDDKRLPNPLRQPLSHRASNDVVGAAGGKRDADPRRHARPTPPKPVQRVALSKVRISALWRQKLFPASVKVGSGAMTGALLSVVVLGVIVIALAVDLAALVAWLRRRWR